MPPPRSRKSLQQVGAELYAKCLSSAQSFLQSIISDEEAFDQANVIALQTIPVERLREADLTEDNAKQLLSAVDNPKLRTVDELIEKWKPNYDDLYLYTQYFFLYSLYSACDGLGFRGYLHQLAGLRSATEIEQLLRNSVSRGESYLALSSGFSHLVELGNVFNDYYSLSAAYTLHAEAARRWGKKDWWVHYEFARSKARKFLPRAKNQYADDAERLKMLDEYERMIG